MFEWNKSLDIGYPDIDQQHQQWIDLLNKLEHQLLNGTSKNEKENRLLILKDILDFTSTHFKNEEEIMKRCNYPNIVEHYRMHKDFHQKVYDLYREVLDGNYVLDSELISILRNWFLSHTQNEDRKAFQYCSKSKLSAPDVPH
ncbi:bacteriohemerythrin [Desulfopila sp. IMCC35008]|uniref:bacteriohemerythrin n=1 Tax=Desulfopila sp. IMCC35008 TaxID=2653858 RepID=UPI0013D02EEF|nr:bacteriohemerythrin [Desulfopila sp. IMCC35008]